MKISIRTSQFFDRESVIRRVSRARLQYLRRAGGTVRMIARRSIKKTGFGRKAPKKFNKNGKITKAWAKWWQEVRARKPSPPGQPIRTHVSSGGARDAILFAYDQGRDSVVVGYSATGIDQIGALHEYGGTRFGARYPARPVIGPALEKAQPKLAEFWRDSIK